MSSIAESTKVVDTDKLVFRRMGKKDRAPDRLP